MLRDVIVDLANTLRDEEVIDESECFIDTAFASAKGGGDATGPTKRGKGVKIITIVDDYGLPLSVSTHATNHHKVTLVQLSFYPYMIEAKPENLICDKAYDSDKLDDELRGQGIKMIAPHNHNRVKDKTLDERRLRRYQRRCIVERLFLLGYNGNISYWCVGNTIPGILLSLYSSQPSQCSLGNFEIGSSIFLSTLHYLSPEPETSESLLCRFARLLLKNTGNEFCF